MAEKHLKLDVVTGSMLTKYLRVLAADTYTMDEDGNTVDRAKALALHVWRSALGWEEPDPDDPSKITKHKPNWQAVVLLYDRIEGRVTAAVMDTGGQSLPEKIGDLAKARINQHSDATQPEPEGEENE